MADLVARYITSVFPKKGDQAGYVYFSKVDSRKRGVLIARGCKREKSR